MQEDDSPDDKPCRVVKGGRPCKDAGQGAHAVQCMPAGAWSLANDKNGPSMIIPAGHAGAQAQLRRLASTDFTQLDRLGGRATVTSSSLRMSKTGAQSQSLKFHLGVPPGAWC
jgi:hypothetical protein